MASSIRTASVSRIAFGFRTSFEIFRSLDRSGIPQHAKPSSEDARRTAARASLPKTLPGSGEIADRLNLVRAMHPSLAFSEPAHLLVASGARHSLRPHAVVHSCQIPLTRRAFLKLDESTLAASPNLALCQAASGQASPIHLLLLLWEACGTYATSSTDLLSASETTYDRKPLTSTVALRLFCSQNPSANGARKIMRLIRFVSNGSASPRETALALILGLPRRFGGFNLGIPHMNWKVTTNKKARAICNRATLRCDLCWPEARIDVEYQSSQEHQGERSRISDSTRTNALASMGWTVIGVTSIEAQSLAAISTIATTVRKLLGKRARPETLDLHQRRMRLRRELGLI